MRPMTQLPHRSLARADRRRRARGRRRAARGGGAARRAGAAAERLAPDGEARSSRCSRAPATRRRAGSISTATSGRGKTMLMDLFFACVRVRAEAAQPLPRVHGRRARAHRRRPPGRSTAIRSRTSPPASPQEAGAPMLRRDAGDRHRRRDDPRTVVQASLRARRRRRGDVELGARRRCTSTASTGSSSCRSSG